jgi:hypothetical protein
MAQPNLYTLTEWIAENHPDAIDFHSIRSVKHDFANIAKSRYMFELNAEPPKVRRPDKNGRLKSPVFAYDRSHFSILETAWQETIERASKEGLYYSRPLTIPEIRKSPEFIEAEATLVRLMPEIDEAIERVRKLCGDRYYVYITGKDGFNLAIRHNHKT